MSRRMLQVVNGFLALLTIGLAAMSLIFGGNSPVYGDAEIPTLPTLDSNLRFFGGLGAGLGIMLLWITPRIEEHTFVFRGLWLTALLGGIGRVISMVAVGMPALPMVIFTAIEVPLVPILIYWQKQVAQSSDGQ